MRKFITSKLPTLGQDAVHHDEAGLASFLMVLWASLLCPAASCFYGLIG